MHGPVNVKRIDIHHFFNSKSILCLQSVSRFACLQLSLEQAVTIFLKPFKELVFVIENVNVFYYAVNAIVNVFFNELQFTEFIALTLFQFRYFT